jgi:peptide/nickel transport system permease protein
MARLIVDRLLQMIIVLLCSTVLGFLLVSLLKGDVLAALLGDNYSEATAAPLKHQLHLDQPLPIQYLRWLGGVLHGDFGTSLVTHQSVAHAIRAALGPTVELLIGAQIVALLLAVLVTVVAVRWRWTDRLVTAFALLCNSIPPFVVGLLLIIAFAATHKWLPALGWAPPGTAGWGANLKAMLMPWVALGVSVFPEYMRVLRGQVYEQIDNEEYVTLARMKGLSAPRILGRHVAPNSVSGLITLVAITTGFLISGVVIVEQVFGIPGIGSLIYKSIQSRDSQMLEGGIVLIAAAVVVFNLIGELLQMRLDPRVRPAR